MPSEMKQLAGRYHPDDEINAGIAKDAHAGEVANVEAGYRSSPWECTCGRAHNRGYFPGHGSHRCLSCGYVGDGGRYMDEDEFARYREDA